MKLRSKLWAEVITVLGVTSTLASFFPINERLKQLLLVLAILIIAIRGLFFYLQVRKRSAFNSKFLLSANKVHNVEFNNAEFEIVVCSTESDVVRCAQYEASFFPEVAFNPKTVIAMWKKFPRAITYLKKKNDTKIVGLVSIWPISKAAYEELILGSWQESDISHRSVLREPGTYWWLGTLELSNEYHMNPGAIRTLFMASISNWLHELEAHEIRNVKLVATAQSDQGLKLLEHLGFVKHVDKDPQTYGIDGTSRELANRLEQLLPRFWAGLSDRLEALRIG